MSSTTAGLLQMPPFYNVASEACVTEGDNISRQLLMRNYLLAAGNASLTHYSQVITVAPERCAIIV